MKSAQLTLEHLYNQGQQNPKLLAKLTGLHLATVYRSLKKLRQNGNLVRKKGSGRRTILKPKDRRRLLQLARKHDTSSSIELQTLMVEKGSPASSSRTIRRNLNKAGYFNLVPKKKSPSHHRPY